MADGTELPQVLDAEQENVKTLQREKRKAAKDFSWSRHKSIDNAYFLALYLYVYGRDDEVIEVCRFLGRYEPEDPIDGFIWCAVQGALALNARIERSRGNDEVAHELVSRITTVHHYTDNWLTDDGPLEQARKSAQAGVTMNSKAHERDWLLTLLGRLCERIEIGRFDKLDTTAWEEELFDTLVRLRELLKVG